MKLLRASVIRADGRIERMCFHGVGHPVGHVDASKLGDPKWEWIWTHGCCVNEAGEACCSEYQTQRGL